MAAKKLGGDVVLFNAGHILDVFWGQFGWKSHARFQRKRVGNKFHLSQVSGIPCPLNVRQHVEESV